MGVLHSPYARERPRTNVRRTALIWGVKTLSCPGSQPTFSTDAANRGTNSPWWLHRTCYCFSCSTPSTWQRAFERANFIRESHFRNTENDMNMLKAPIFWYIDPQKANATYIQYFVLLVCYLVPTNNIAPQKVREFLILQIRTSSTSWA